MVLPNDSINVTPGSGATVPTHLVGGKKYEVIMEADYRGHIKGSYPGFLAYYTPATNALNREVAELFNGSSSNLVLVRGIWIIPTATAITGAQIGFDINRISSAGTGGTAVTPRPLDTNDSLPAGITAAYGSTGGATLQYTLFQVYFFNEETVASTELIQFQNLLPVIGDYAVEIVLRPNQGIQIKQSVSNTVGLTGALIYFVVV